MKETPKTFLIQDVEDFVGYPMPSLANMTRADLSKLVVALQSSEPKPSR